MKLSYIQKATGNKVELGSIEPAPKCNHREAWLEWTGESWNAQCLGCGLYWIDVLSDERAIGIVDK